MGLVWNKGIAALCDRRFPDEFPDGKNYLSHPACAGALWSSRLPDNLISNPSACSGTRDGELIWVRLSWLRSFVRQVLPLLRSSFVLVTGDSDSCVPSELGREARAVLDCSKVTHWYTQNYDGSIPSDRISPIPIGIDFHMLSERAIWGEEVSTPREQERTLTLISKNLPVLRARVQRVYVDFGWQPGFSLFHHRRFHPLVGTRFHEHRRHLAKRLRGNELVSFQTAPLPQERDVAKTGGIRVCPESSRNGARLSQDMGSPSTGSYRVGSIVLIGWPFC